MSKCCHKYHQCPECFPALNEQIAQLRADLAHVTKERGVVKHLLGVEKELCQAANAEATQLRERVEKAQYELRCWREFGDAEYVKRADLALTSDPEPTMPERIAAAYGAGQRVSGVVTLSPETVWLLDCALRALDAVASGGGQEPIRLVCEALREAAMRGQPFELAVLDMHMPHMDGMQLARLIRADPALARTRLVMLTSTCAAGSAEERERAGILRYVNKPVRQSELREVLVQALSIAPSSAPAATARATPTGDLRGRVLLAEDNPVNQALAHAMLKRLGLTVAVANDGKEALALAAAQPFDLVLMDCQMPVMDGYQATARLREREAGRAEHLPVVALTANVMEDDRNLCLAVGMDDYLAKPYTAAQLEQTLRRWLPAGP